MDDRTAPRRIDGLSGGVDRRRFLRRSAMAGVAVWAAPSVVSVSRAFAQADPSPDGGGGGGGGGGTTRTQVLFEGFSGTPCGAPTTNLGAGNEFQVTAGNVDVIGEECGTFDINTTGLGANGKYLDLDGTTAPATLQSVDTFAAGNYEVRVRLAGNRRGFGNDTVQIRLGDLTQNVVLVDTAPFADFTYPAVVTTPDQLEIELTSPADSRGALLDEVEVTLIT